MAMTCSASCCSLWVTDHGITDHGIMYCAYKLYLHVE